MKQRVFRLCAFALIAALMHPAAQAARLNGRVVAVADGDTVTLLDARLRRHQIRLLGIDAPEKDQAYGLQSRANLAQQVFGRQVVADCRQTDRYHRKVCLIEIDGQDVNLAQIEAGLAWHYKSYTREQKLTERLQYATAETQARLARRGLWSQRAPLAPWDYRAQRRG